MKFILFNINDTNKNKINKIELDGKHYINEVSLSETMLKYMDNEPKGLIAKLKYTIYDKNFEKQILKSLENWNSKWSYVISNNMVKSKYLSHKIENLLGYKFVTTNELDNNIFKYIDEYLEKNKSLKKYELKVLVVANKNENLNFTVINNLIKQHKVINIYLNENPSSYISEKIKQINKNEGTTIEIVKKERKSFVEYNVVYFIDCNKQDYPRLRFNKNALILDNENIDKFNSNIIFINEYMKSKDNFKNRIEYLTKSYDLLQIAGVIRKTVTELDKT